MHSAYEPGQRLYVKRAYIPDVSGVWNQNCPVKVGETCNQNCPVKVGETCNLIDNLIL